MVCTSGLPHPSRCETRRRLARRRSHTTACALGLLLVATAATAATSARAQTPSSSTEPDEDPHLAEQLQALGKHIDSEARVFGSLEVGRGLRFNNPYRLATELGKDAQSVSLTPTYVDFGLGAAIGPPDGLQHGGALHVSVAVAGVSQVTLTPSYLLAYHGPRAFLVYGRLGPSIILTPDPSVGGEVAGGFAWYLTGKIAVAAELVFDLYYGAGTHEVGVATYPILSGQLGLLIDHELLP